VAFWLVLRVFIPLIPVFTDGALWCGGKNTGKLGLTIDLRINTKEFVFGKNIDMVRRLKLYHILPRYKQMFCG
jgi:hypothetical protein